MSIAVTGASGLIGSALVAALAGQERVIRLVRRQAQSPDEVEWNPTEGHVDLVAMESADVDVIVHLAGAGVGDHRWTPAYKQLIRDSRVQGTRTIAEAAARLPTRPALVSGSAIGWYGDTGDTFVDEDSSPGTGFLADVVREWEAAASPAVDAGLRVTFARTGLVVSSRGGAFGRMIPLFRAGVGGRLGSGRQYWSFVSLRDEVAALLHLGRADVEGPVNLVAPTPVRNSEATRVLASQAVVPTRLQGSGFEWSDPTLASALTAALGNA